MKTSRRFSEEAANQCYERVDKNRKTVEYLQTILRQNRFEYTRKSINI